MLADARPLKDSSKNEPERTCDKYFHGDAGTNTGNPLQTMVCLHAEEDEWTEWRGQSLASHFSFNPFAHYRLVLDCRPFRYQRQCYHNSDLRLFSFAMHKA